MTISTTSNKTGLFAGTGSSGPFAFTFKTFASGDLEVIKVSALGVESVLTETSQYSVSLNADQNNNPGGSVTTTTPVASGEGLMVRRLIDVTQLTDIQNAGGFYPEVLENALDKVTMGLQQHDEMLSRAILMDATDATPPASASEVLAAGVGAAAAAVAAAASAAASAASAALSADKVPLAGGTMTGALNMGSGARLNHARGVVASAAEVDVWSAGDTVEITGAADVHNFTDAPQAGARRTLICSGACTFVNEYNAVVWSEATALSPGGATYGPNLLPLSDGRLLALCKGASDTEAYLGTPNGGLTDIAWVSSTPLPVSVYESSAVSLLDGRVLYLAGYTGAIMERSVHFGTVSGNTISWVPGSALPAIYSDHTSSRPPERGVGVLLDGRVFIIGGYGTGGSATDAVYLGTVSGEGITWAAATVLPATAAVPYATVLSDGRLYVRNYNGSFAYFGSVSGNTITWTAATTTEPTYLGQVVRHAGLASLSDGRLLMVGGTTDSPAYNLDEVFLGAVSGTTVTWTAANPTETGNVIHGTPAVVVLDDVAFILPTNASSDYRRVQLGLMDLPVLLLENGDYTAAAGAVVEAVADTRRRVLIRPVKTSVAGGTNLGTGAEVFETLSGTALRFRTLTAGTNITITENANDISIASAASTGEANTASNLGAGNGVFESKSGVDLRFKSLVAGTNVSITNTGTEITVNATSTSGGTVTHSAGALTASAVMVGNGADDSKVLASLGTTTTVLHGNAAGLPTWGAIALASEVSGILPVANGGTGTANAMWSTEADPVVGTNIVHGQTGKLRIGDYSAWVQGLLGIPNANKLTVVGDATNPSPGIFATKSSLLGFAGGSLALFSLAHNDNASYGTGNWSFYTEIRNMSTAHAGSTAIGYELAVINKKSSVVVVTPYAGNPAGLTEGLRLGCGKPGEPDGYNGYAASAAMSIVNVSGTSRFNVGINVHNDSIEGSAGGAGAIAIALPYQYGIQWYISSGAFGPAIRSDVSTAGGGMKFVFANNGISFQNGSSVPVSFLSDAGVLTLGAGTVSYGAADSGGAGYRLMRVPN